TVAVAFLPWTRRAANRRSGPTRVPAGVVQSCLFPRRQFAGSVQQSLRPAPQPIRWAAVLDCHNSTNAETAICLRREILPRQIVPALRLSSVAASAVP